MLASKVVKSAACSKKDRARGASKPIRAAGFTLAEMLVALFIFALISTAAVSILTFTLRSDEALDARIAKLDEFARARAVMKADLGQITGRLTRDEDGYATGLSFAGGADVFDRPPLAFVRGGWENFDDAPRSSLQYVEYHLDGERLLRRARVRVDPTEETPAVERVLVDGVRELTVEFYAGGRWSDIWSAGYASTALPPMVAIEMDVEGFGRIRQVFLTSAGPQ